MTRATGLTDPPLPRTPAEALAADLRMSVRGEVRFDRGSRALYATDASNYRQVPIGVVIPRDAEDVLATVSTAREHGAPVLPRGGGTSLAGQCCNAALVMDMSRYLNHILELEPERRLARVQPGLVLDHLRDAAEEHGLTFAPDPATHNRCTIGGMVGNDSCGIHSVMAGKTVDNIESLEVLTYDGLRLRVGRTSDDELARIIAAGGRRGEIYAGLKNLRDRYGDLVRRRFPRIPRRVSGYNLDQLLPENGFHVARALVGSEGTCVTVLEATTCLVHSPPARTLLVLGYRDVFIAADAVPEIMTYGPIGLEGFDNRLVDFMNKKGLHPAEVALLPSGGGWLLVEFGGETREEANDRARPLIEAIQRSSDPPDMKLFDDPRQAHMVWTVRESGLGAAALVHGEQQFWPGWEDSAVPPARMGEYLRDLRHLMDQYGYEGAFYGHFGHGCLHTRIDFDLTSVAGIGRFHSFIGEAGDLIVRYGGSFSGEHGDGQARAQLLPKLYGEELVEAFREFKAIWDPDGKMNPGKMTGSASQPVYRIDENLRLGARYHPRQAGTFFTFVDDRGSFSNATLRCVGVGKCRRTDGGTMCPSYMVTREEQHSTRGRARLLFEMLQGNPLDGGWRDEHVKEALDLCLACKGCKGECPVNVDMATYKAEFLAHYYARRLRPATAYTMGLIYWWARLAERRPAAANLLTQTPLLRDAVKALGGVAPQRRIPAFAPQTFREWFRARRPRAGGGAPVIMWPDTFNNHFHPETARAAVEVLERMGYTVLVPEARICCGRPIYDYGMLRRARRLLRQILDALHEEIEAGIPVVGLEPSCVAVFRDELLQLFPNDEDARRLAKQTFLLSELLARQGEDTLPARAGTGKRPIRAIVHGHCHHKAMAGMEDDAALLSTLGLDFEILDSGCCGMAGAFGFEKEHYDVSIRCGERVLLPAVRAAERDTLIIADGFSCREQIAQTTGRRALHLAEVLQAALREG